MSQTKYKMPEDARRTVMGYIQGYPRRKMWYQQQREEILHQGSKRFEEYVMADGRGGRVYFPRSGSTGDNTASRANRLIQLEQHPNVCIMRAIEEAQEDAGADIPSEEERRRVRQAVLDSCVLGRNFTFEYSALPLGKTNFYERRRRFIWIVAKKLRLI